MTTARLHHDNLNSLCFPLSFEQADKKTRTKMHQLRKTWTNEWQGIPNNTLYELDEQVKQIDPNWPITAKPPDYESRHDFRKGLGKRVC